MTGAGLSPPCPPPSRQPPRGGRGVRGGGKMRRWRPWRPAPCRCRGSAAPPRVPVPSGAVSTGRRLPEGQQGCCGGAWLRSPPVSDVPAGRGAPLSRLTGGAAPAALRGPLLPPASGIEGRGGDCGSVTAQLQPPSQGPRHGRYRSSGSSRSQRWLTPSPGLTPAA